MLVDMTKTSSDFRGAGSKALEALADGLLPKLRPIMDELGAVGVFVPSWTGCWGEAGCIRLLQCCEACWCGCCSAGGPTLQQQQHHVSAASGGAACCGCVSSSEASYQPSTPCAGDSCAPVGLRPTPACPCLLAAPQTSFQLSESDYAAGELGGTWVMRLAAALEAQLHWLQPMLTSNCSEAFTLTLLDKVVAMIEVLLGRKVGVGGQR